MKTQIDICIYHDPCPDGFTAAWAVWRRYGDDVQYIGAKYGDPLPDVDGKRVLLVDFSYKREQMLTLAVRAASVTVLDHHLSAEKDFGDLLLDGSVDGVFDMTKSGARLAWEWAHPDEDVPMLVQFVEDRDLWRFKLTGTEEFCEWLNTVERSFDQWNSVRTFTKNPDGLNQAIRTGKILVDKFNREADAIMKSTLQWLEIDGHKVPVCNAPYMYASRIGNELVKKENAPFAATFFINPDGDKLFSLRSLDSKVNVSEVAVKFGGGGHRNASGFKVPASHEFKKVENV